jgi:hypothetical protein
VLWWHGGTGKDGSGKGDNNGKGKDGSGKGEDNDDGNIRGNEN